MSWRKRVSELLCDVTPATAITVLVGRAALALDYFTITAVDAASIDIIINVT